MNTIYLFSGIGCTGAVFGKMTFPEGYTVRHLEWKEPLKREAFPQYCVRMAEGLSLGASDILAGVSFGGIVVQEIARQHPQVERVVVLSSAVDPQEYSRMIRLYRALRLYYITPWSILKSDRLKAALITGKLGGRHVEAVRRFFAPLSTRYYRFAIRACLCFSPSDRALLRRIRRIHGRRDELFPVKRIISPSEDIDGATHLMVYTHAREASKAFAKVIRAPWYRQ